MADVIGWMARISRERGSKIYNNTFRGRRLPINIRGVPEEGAEIYSNWFYRRPTEPDVLTSGNTLVYDNAYGLSDPVVCDTMPAAKTVDTGQ